MRYVVFAGIAFATLTASAQAQRYRVLVGSESGQRNVLEFRPCIPAEGSGCGAWIDREATPDTTARLASATSATFGPGDSVWIEHGAIRIQSTGQRKTLVDNRGAAHALALAPLRDYAFVILRAPSASASTIVMVDLSTRSVIASCPLPSLASTIAVVR
jgi:hypothetical protein